MIAETFKRLDFSRIREILAQKCATLGGKKLAKSLSPARSVELAERRFAETDEALVFQQSLPFSACSPLDELTVELKEGKYLPARNFLKLANGLKAVAQVKKRLTSGSIPRESKIKLLREYGEQITVFDNLVTLIFATVDEDGVKESASPRLTEIRRSIASERKSVLRTLDAMATTRPEIFQETAVHFREGRLVLALRRDREAELEGVVHGTSSAGATVFIEPYETVALNNQLRKLREEEREEIERILIALATAIRERLYDIEVSLELIAELDFIFARADWARSLKANRVNPNARVMEIYNARHPLLLMKREVVPLDIKLEPETRVLLISGPNAGGKTVVLKTLGLIAMLAASGLHVPASPDTAIPFYRKVFIDIGDEQSIDDNLSSFTAHIANLKLILEQADSASLVLLDELGSSTSPEEGGALAMAVLETLAEKGATVIATTHFESLKSFAEGRKDMQNAGMEFTNHPTYKLQMGIPGTSNALQAAEEQGFPTSILKRARTYINPDLLESSAIISNLSAERNRVQKLRLELEQELLESRSIKQSYLKAQAKLEEMRKRFSDDIAVERAKLLSETRKQLEYLVKEIKESKASRESVIKAKAYIKNQEEALRAYSDSTELSGVQTSLPTLLQPGDKVRSKKLARQGMIVEIDEKRGEAMVEMGSLKIALALSDLEVLEHDESFKNKATFSLNPTIDSNYDELEFNTQLSIRGMYAEDAYQCLLAYINEAYALGISEVSILHGKGTGVLRSMVMEFARSSNLISSFRVGEPFEGGGGVTILRLKV